MTTTPTIRTYALTAKFPGDSATSTQQIDASGVIITTNGALHAYRKGPKHLDSRELVIALGPGEWVACEPVE